MFEFFPAQLRGIEIDLRALAELDPNLSTQLSSNDAEYDPASEDHPFVQLAYGEIDQEALERILAFAGIFKANRPLGLPYDCSPHTFPGTDGRDWQLYPLTGLADHLRLIQPDTLKMLDAYDSLDDLFESMENEGRDVTAEQYLVLALTETIRFCKNRNIGLAAHW